MANPGWSFIFVPLGLALVFWLLRKIFPAPAEPEKAEAEIQEVSLKESNLRNIQVGVHCFG